ncbi:glycoside hydrolase family 3 protein, partial [Nocardia cerradoensis]
AAENRWLLTEILREEWGFDGAVVSDWGAVHNRVAALAAGLDLEMPGNPRSAEEIVAAVRSGALTPDLVAAAARRVAALAEAQPTAAGDAEISVDLDAHHALARELAAECVVLLKNDGGLLPLGPDLGTIAVIGTFASEPRYQGGGSSHINPTRVDEPLAAIRELATARDQTVHYAAGLDSGALAAAAGSDVAVVFAGLAETTESEGYDRRGIELPAEQIAMIRAVAAVAKRTVVVLSHGGVVSLEGWHDEVDAILDGFLLGQAGGGALADLLFGVAAPSGRLAETIPLRLQDNPSYLNFPGEAGQVRYGEGVMVGYRYYGTVGLPVRYPFGHGLTYTEFAVSGLEVDVHGPDTATARVTVTNIGDRAGKYVVQLYVATSAGPVRRPARELRAFTKVALDPGAAQTVELALDRRAFAYYDVERGDWAVAGGEYVVQIGENAERIVAERAVSLAGDAQLLELSLESTVGEWFGHPTVGPRLLESMAAGLTDEQRQEAEANMHLLEMISSMPMSQFVAFTGVELKDDALHSLIELSRTAPAGA